MKIAQASSAIETTKRTLKIFFWLCVVSALICSLACIRMIMFVNGYLIKGYSGW
jgi:hypothetical protein